MASNYPLDPKNAASIGNPVTPQGGAGASGTAPEYPLPPVAPQVISTPSSAEGSRRLPAGILLSAGRSRIVSRVAYGGNGAVYRAVNTRLNVEPCTAMAC